uniref:Calcium-transporting ATPase (EC) n=1 Tax=Ganoderma boninense TaxID=34458 RepID=A0A5K1K1C4_9APHY|nr:Calcium-transporting ATPase (EC [Ganoderma boninense]
MIDMLTLYTVESGMLTCIATAISLFFWLFLRSNFVFLGMHLAINKLYANSLLASLNARKSLATKVTGSDRHPLPVILPTSRMSGPQHYSHHGRTAAKPLQVAVDIERTIQHDDVILETESDSPTPSLGANTSRKSVDALDLLKTRRE